MYVPMMPKPKNHHELKIIIICTSKEIGCGRLPLQRVLISPATAPEKVLDTRTAPVRWEPQEEGVMRTAASFPPVRNQGLSNQ